jgi:hypothetical protein
VASSGVQPAEVAQLMGNLRAGWAQPPTDTMADIKPHLQKVEVPVTPGLAVSLEVLLQNSLANVREIKKPVTVLVGKYPFFVYELKPFCVDLDPGQM